MIEYIEALAWPVVALVAILALRPVLHRLLSGSMVKISAGGVEIKTTLPEIEGIISEKIGGKICSAEEAIVAEQSKDGEIPNASGTTNADRKLLRPLRNAGLIMTIPRHAFLADAKSIQLTSLGELYSRALQAGDKSYRQGPMTRKRSGRLLCPGGSNHF